MVLLPELYEGYFLNATKNPQKSHFWSFLGWPTHFLKELGHEISYGKPLSDDSAPVKLSAKLDNFKVPKNGPKVAKKVRNDAFSGKNHP